MGEAGAADQHMSGVRMVQRRQNFLLGQQGCVVMAGAQPEAFDLLLQLDARFDGGQRQFTHALRTQHFAQLAAVYDADTTLAIIEFELH